MVMKNLYKIRPSNRNILKTYQPEFADLCHALKIDNSSLVKETNITVNANALKEIIKELVKTFEFDEKYYVQNYPDIKQALQDKLLNSAKEHYIRAGYFEGRTLEKESFDEDWYLDHYKDVSKAIKNGVFTSAYDHYEQTGRKERRSPNEEIHRGRSFWRNL